jgi:hypothetical protein
MLLSRKHRYHTAPNLWALKQARWRALRRRATTFMSTIYYVLTSEYHGYTLLM